MPSVLLEYRLRIRDAADTTDVLVVSSVRGDTLPYLTEAPHGDGAEFDPITGAYRSGSTTFRIADAITSGTSRVVTSQLEDANFRQQLASRPAYGEERVNGGTWTNIQAGIVTAIRLASSAVYEIDVGDATRATRNLVAFAPKRDAVDATKIESIATWMARWPHRGTIVGGPVLGGFLARADLGGWEMRVADRQVAGTTSYTPSGGSPVTTTTRIAYLSFDAGYAAPGFTRSTRMKDIRDGANSALGPVTWSPSTSFPADIEVAWTGWSDLVVQVGTQYFGATNAFAGFAGRAPDNVFLSDTRDTTGLFVWDSAQRLTVGAAVRVHVFDALPTERCPIYYSGHPVDLWMKLCDEAGLTYDATAAGTCKDALGRNLRINLRITGSQAWASFVESVLYGPCGFSARTDATGRLVPFATRVMSTALPSVTLTSADVPQAETVLFELTEADAITKLTVNQTNLVTTPTPGGSIAALDGVEQQSVQVIRTSGDAGGPVQREQSYTIPGFLDTGSGTYESTLVDALARNVFDRYGRGRIAGETLALRGASGDAVVLGQEVVLALTAMPNHNLRYGDDNTVGGRVVQLVRITQEPSGKRCRVIDSGPNAQPASPVPTLTVAAGTALGSALVSITTAATLNAALIGVRVQWAQTTGAAPSAADYTDVAWYDYGKVPTVAVALPPASPGNTVYVRARSEQANHRPSAYSTAVSVATLGFSAPTSLTATPDATDGSRCVLAWAIGTGASTLVTDVFLRLQIEPAGSDILRDTLLAGSVAALLDGLTPGTAYTASVQHRDPVTGATSTKTTVNFTAGAGTLILPSPTLPMGIVGRTTAGGVPRIDGTYGLNVTAAVLPGTIEFWEAVETGVASGVYGTAVRVDSVAAAVGRPTEFRRIAPNDKLRRSLTARHVRTGVTSSAFTSAVVVDPWGAIAGPPVVGGPLPPTATLTLNAAEATVRTATVHLALVPGTTPAAGLSYTLTQKYGRGAPTTIGAGLGSALPLDVAVNRHLGIATVVSLSIVDPLLAAPLVVNLTIPDDGQQYAYASGHAIGSQAVDETRVGRGGMATPRGRILTDPPYTRDGSTPLIDTDLGQLTGAMGAADGLGAPESSYMGKRRVVRGGGHIGVQVIVDDARAGAGGIPTPHARYQTDPVYTQDGSTALLDTIFGRIGSTLQYPGGAGIDALRPAEGGANVTETRTSADTSAVSGRAAGTVRDDARFRGPRNAGHATGMVITDDSRSGTGGVPTPSARYGTAPIYDPTGAILVYDPVLRIFDHMSVRGTLDGPNGSLGGGVTQKTASQDRLLFRGYQSGYARDGETVNFSPVFQSPVVRLTPNRLHSTTLAAGEQRPGWYASSLGGSSFVLVNKIRTLGTITARSAEFTSPLTATTGGSTVGPATLANAPSLDNNYKARFGVVVALTTLAEAPADSVTVVIAIEVDPTGSSGYTEYATRSYSTNRTTAGTTTNTSSGVEVTVNVPSCVSTGKVRLKLKSITQTTGNGSASVTLTGYANAGSDGHGVTYNTASGSSEENNNPDATDSVFWEAWEATV